MSDFGQLQELCRRLGASEEQAGTMARQLRKRAEQLAVERNISQEKAMEHLLWVLVHGRKGEVPPGFEKSPPQAEGKAEG